MTDVPLIELLAPREITAALVQEHLDELAEDCPSTGAIPPALVEVIARMTVAGMTAAEISTRLEGVEWAPGYRVNKPEQVEHMRQIRAGTKRVPRPRRQGGDPA